jgi:hypothetical protein
MSDTLKVVEPLMPHPHLSDQFACGGAVCAPVVIYRLLTGTVNINRAYDGREIRCRHDFVRQRTSLGRATDRNISTGLFGEDVSIDDAKSFLMKFRSQNVGFFKQLQVEICHCILHLKLNNDVESFLHFYRALERLSVAFPAIYISGQTEFVRVHSFLKDVVSSKDDGELSLISNFCNFIAINSDVLSEYILDFDFDAYDLDQKSRILSEIRAILPTKMAEKMTEENGKISFPYKMVPSFLITCRNRLFHNSNTGQRNFDVDRMGGAAVMCHGLVNAGLHWLALTYIEVVRNRAGRF